MKLIQFLGPLLLATLPLGALADEADAQSVAQPFLTSALQHTQIDGKRVAYRATFDRIDVSLDGIGEAASITAIGYIVEPADTTTRPVMFAFNGGPGASSILQVGGLGPLLRISDGDRQKLVANPDSILDTTDLVFIDPPGTGFSKSPADSAARKLYWSDHADAKIVEAMIRGWLKAHRREHSPLYIAGESYGGYRLALLSAGVADLHPAGILLISPLLDATGTDDTAGNDLRAIFDLPSLVVASAKHGKGILAGQPAADVFTQARQFALSDYAQALMMGSALPVEKRHRVEGRLSELLGTSSQPGGATSLRPDVETFRQSLIADDGQQIGRLDSRIKAPLPKPHADEETGRPSAANDPALGLGKTNQIRSAVMADYLRRLFGASLPGDYISLDIDIAMAWTFTPEDGITDRQFGSALRFNPTQNFAKLAENNPDFHVLALNGYYDLAVPALGPWYALHHTTLDPERIDYQILPAGHAVFDEASLRPQLHDLLKAFLK